MDDMLRTTPAALWAAWLQGSMQFWGAAPLGRCLRMHRAGVALSGEGHLAMNWGMVDAGDTCVADLGEIVAALRALHLPAYLLFTRAAASTLGPVARTLGLAPAGSLPLMIRDTSPVAPSGRSIRMSHVSQEDERQVLASIAAAAFEVPTESVVRAFDPLWLDLPDIDLFLAWDGGLPVSACVTTRTGGWTGIWAMSTAPDRRRQGHCSSLLGAVIEYHRPRSDLFYLSATPMGVGIYRRLGFVTADEAEEWDFIC